MRALSFIFIILLALLGNAPQALAQATTSGLTPCGAGASLTATSVSSNTQLSVCGGTVVVYNIGAVEAFLNWGTASTTTATTSGWSVPPGFAIVLNSGRAGLFLAAITSSGSTTLRVVQGNGAPALGGGTPASGASSAVTVVDGGDVAQGATADAACSTDNGTCTVIALLKRENQRLTTIIAALGSPLQAGGNVVDIPSSAAAAANTPVVTGALATSLVLKASAGNLYSLNVSADSTLSGAAWWVMVHNTATAPAAGAVTPTKCYALASGTTMLAFAFPTPVRFGTGISVTVSTTGCFTQTDSVHAFISGDVQ